MIPLFTSPRYLFPKLTIMRKQLRKSSQKITDSPTRLRQRLTTNFKARSDPRLAIPTAVGFNRFIPAQLASSRTHLEARPSSMCHHNRFSLKALLPRGRRRGRDLSQDGFSSFSSGDEGDYSPSRAQPSAPAVRCQGRYPEGSIHIQSLTSVQLLHQTSCTIQDAWSRVEHVSFCTRL